MCPYLEVNSHPLHHSFLLGGVDSGGPDFIGHTLAALPTKMTTEMNEVLLELELVCLASKVISELKIISESPSRNLAALTIAQ